MIFGWGGNGWGGFGGGAGAALNGAITRSDLSDALGFQNLDSSVRGVQQGICDSTFALNNTIVNGFANNARDLCTGLNAVTAGIAENRFANQQCCCDIQSAITNAQFANQTGLNNLSTQLAQCCCDNRAGQKDIQYQMATDTCAIQNTIQNTTRDVIDNQNANYRGLMEFMVNSKIESLQSENQALRLAASQSNQNNILMAAMDANKAEILRRTGAECPIPAYVVPNPNCCYGNPIGVNYGGYGYNNGCGCNNNSGCGCC